MIAGTLEIQMLANMARLQQDMDAAKRTVGDAMGNIERSVAQAKAVIASLGVGLGLREIIAMSDQYTLMSGKIKNATTSQLQFNQVMDDARRIAATAQADLGGIAQSYARLLNNTRDLNVSQSALSSIVETTSLALKVNGASVAESASALQQLSQAFGKGKLDGDEFRTMMEASPGLMRRVAESMGVPFGALKDLAAQGKITGDVLVKAFSGDAYLNDLREQASGMMTISGAFQVLKNNVMEFVGASAKSSGTISVLTSGITMLAGNLQLILGVMATLAASKFGAWLAAGTAELYSSVAASRAAASAVLVKAEADAAATAATVALTTARVAELRSAVIAAEGNVALAITTNGLIPAQIRAAAAVTANTAAIEALSVAQRGASMSAGVAGGAIALLGGPIGALITILGLAATAWMVFGQRAKTAMDEINANIEAGIAVAQRYAKEAKFGAGDVGVLTASLDGLYSKLDVLAQSKGPGAAAALAKVRGEIALQEAALDKAGKATVVATVATVKLTEEQKKAVSDYQQQVKSAEAYIESLKRETAAMSMTEEQKKHMEAVNKAAIAPTVALSKATLAAAAARAIEAERIKDVVAAEKMRLDQTDAYIELLNQREMAESDAKQTLEDKVIAINEETFALTANAEEIKNHNIQLALQKSGLDKTSDAFIEYKKRLEDAYASNTVAKAAKESQDEWKGMWSTVEKTGHDVFVNLFSEGKSAFEGIGKAIKASVIDLLYQMTAKKWLISLGASITGSGASGIAGAAGAAQTGSSALSLASNASSLYSAATLSGGAALGSGLYSAGSAVGSAGMMGYGAGIEAASLGAVGSGGASVVGAAGAVGSEAFAAGAAGASSGIGAALAAIPVWGWVALAALAIFGMSGSSGAPKVNVNTLFKGGSGGIDQLSSAGGGDSLSSSIYDANVAAVVGKYAPENDYTSYLGGHINVKGNSQNQNFAYVNTLGRALNDVNESGDGVIYNNKNPSFGKGTDDWKKWAEKEIPRMQLAIVTDALRTAGGEVETIAKMVMGTASNLTDTINLLDDSGVQEKLAHLMDGLSILSYVDAKPLEDYAAAAEQANRTLMDVWRDSGDALNDLISAYDGSAASTKTLSAATQSQYQLELQLIGQIQNALASTQGMFGNSIESIKLSVMDKGGQYDYMRTQADTLYQQLQTAIDPAQIQKLAEQINQYTNQAYGLLDEGQKQGAAGGFIEYLTKVQDLTTQQLNNQQDTVIATHDAVADAITSSMDAASDIMAEKVAAAVSEAVAAALAIPQPPLNLSVAVSAPIGAEVSVFEG